MKTVRLAVFAAVLACVFAGCALFSRNSSYDTYEHLLRLYQAGKIDAQQLTSRQHGIAVREEYARAHPAPDTSSSSTDTATTTDDKGKDACKKQDPQHPDPHCPMPPGHR